MRAKRAKIFGYGGGDQWLDWGGTQDFPDGGDRPPWETLRSHIVPYGSLWSLMVPY